MTATLNKRERGVAVFLDMEKAFDRVWHAGLIFKLSQTEGPRRIIKVVSSFLHNRTFRVVVEGELSSARPVAAGVPQGSCMSPVCYSLYTDDIPTTQDTTLALYADDAAYIATSLNVRHAAVKMQRVLDLLPEWLSKWRLSVNVSKTQAIVIGACRLPPPLKLLGADVRWALTAKYLGVTIDSRLTMRSHVRQVAAKSRTTSALLRPVLSSRLPLRAKLGIYKTYIRPIITYATPAWLALTSETNRKTLRVQQNLALRRITDAPRFVRNDVIQRDLQIESLEEFSIRLASNMYARASTSNLAHIKDIAPWHARPPDARRLPRDLIPNADAHTTPD